MTSGTNNGFSAISAERLCLNQRLLNVEDGQRGRVGAFMWKGFLLQGLEGRPQKRGEAAGCPARALESAAWPPYGQRKWVCVNVHEHLEGGLGL